MPGVVKETMFNWTVIRQKRRRRACDVATLALMWTVWGRGIERLCTLKE